MKALHLLLAMAVSLMSTMVSCPKRRPAEWHAVQAGESAGQSVNSDKLGFHAENVRQSKS